MKRVSDIIKYVLTGWAFFMGQLIAEEEGEGWEKKAKEAIEKFIKQYQGGRFTYISSGPFFHLPRETVFGVWVTAKTQETIQSGRALALTFTKNFLNELQNNEDTAKWYAYMCKTRPSWYSGKLSLKYVGIRIAFWDENVERPKAPYLSEIGFYADKFRYYEADPKTQALKLVLEESYSDALKHQQEAQAENKTGS